MWVGSRNALRSKSLIQSTGGVPAYVQQCTTSFFVLSTHVLPPSFLFCPYRCCRRTFSYLLKEMLCETTHLSHVKSSKWDVVEILKFLRSPITNFRPEILKSGHYSPKNESLFDQQEDIYMQYKGCLLYTSPSPRD